MYHATINGGESPSASPERVRFVEPDLTQGASPKASGSGVVDPPSSSTAVRPWDLQFKAQSDRLIHLERAHAKAQEAVAKSSQVVQGVMENLSAARKELLEAQEEETRRNGELQAGQQELEALRQKVAEPPQGERNAKVAQVLQFLGGTSLSWEQVMALEELQSLVAPGDGAATAPAAGSGALEDPYATWYGGAGQPTGHAGTDPTGGGPSADGGGNSLPPEEPEDGGTPTPVPSPAQLEEPEEDELAGGADEDMPEEPMSGSHARSQSLPGGGRGKNRGRSPAKRAERVAKDSLKIKTDAKGKRGKAVDALRASFAKAAVRKGPVATEEGAEGGCSRPEDLSHRGQGSLAAV